MAMTTRDQHHYGDSQADIRESLAQYSAEQYPIHDFADAVCTCGNKTFELAVDDDEGAAIRVCAACEDVHLIGDSESYIDDADLEACTCLCDNVIFEITAGVALHEDSQDVRWFYIGCRCSGCGLMGCYGDWKNEFNGYRELLANI